MERDTKTVVFLVRGLEVGVAVELWRGITKTVHELGLNLITLFGNKLGEHPGNIIYDLVRKQTVDGIITWASSENDRFTEYYRNYAGIPMISLTLPLPGLPVVMIDSYSAMKDAISHLIQAHHRRKIVFVRGPERHVSAQERFKAYCDALSENGIPLDDNLITPCYNFTNELGREAFRMLVRDRKLEPGRDFDAVAAVNDGMVIAFMEEARNARVNIPDDLSVVGCNFTEQGKCAIPAVTSVSMPFEEQGKTAVTALLEMIKGKKIPEKTTLDAKMEIMQSCGCSFSGGVRTVSVPAIKASLNNSRRKFCDGDVDFLKAECIRVIGEYEKTDQPDPAIDSALHADKIAALAEAFFAEVFRMRKGFLAEFTRYLYAELYEKRRFSGMQHVLSILRSVAKDPMIPAEASTRACDLIDETRMIYCGAVQHECRFQMVESDKLIDVIRDIESNLITATTIEELKKTLLSKMKNFTKNSYFISLYENPAPYVFGDSLPENSRLIIAHGPSGAIETGSEGIRYPTRNILPSGFFELVSGGYSLLVMPLFMKDRQLGMIIFDHPLVVKNIYPLFRDLLSNTFYNVILINELSSTKNELEKTLATLKTKAAAIVRNSRNISERVGEVSMASEKSTAHIREISVSINEVMDIVRGAVSMGKKIDSLVSNMRDHSRQVGQVSGVIYDIAQQTNVLSINAAIEAARAGDTGRGFAIVAREIKELSRKTVQSTDSINGMISLMQKSTGLTTENILALIEIIEKIAFLSEQITCAIKNQTEAVQSMSGLLAEAAGGTREIAGDISGVASGADL